MMLTRLVLKNLTVFPEADFQFAPGLNVIVGENGAGKSHVLKAAYTVECVSAKGEKGSGSPTPTKNYLATAIAKKMRGVFRPDELGRLAQRQAGRRRCEIEAWFQAGPKPQSMGFSFNTSSKTEVSIDRLIAIWEGEPPVFLPTRELLTAYPGFVSL
jgi:AAA15 family ATPase/GTPase